MFNGLRELYTSYGWPWALLRSPYFWAATLLTAGSLESAIDSKWEELTLQVVPSLTGFSIAGFAIVFAVLRPEQVKILLVKRDEKVAPLLKVFSGITHAILVQVLCVLIAVFRRIASSEYWILILDDIVCHTVSEKFSTLLVYGDRVLSAFGLFLLFYGLLLVFSVALTIFQLVVRISNVSQ
jgi:hypothetical protein